MPRAGRSWAASLGSYGGRHEAALRQINGGRLARVEWGMHPWTLLQLIVLLALANGTPVIAKWLLGDHLALPLDGGARFLDGRPLLGHSKTIRGVVLAIVVTSLGAALIGLSAAVGALVGVLAMAGDLLSSFVKRRLGLIASSRATGLDQIPEALLPLVACG